VRSGDWKLIYYHADRRFELFNLRQDIGESEKLVPVNPGKTRELAELLTVYLKSVDAQMPVDRRTMQPVEWPADMLR
jgi:hypothetical protein